MSRVYAASALLASAALAMAAPAAHAQQIVTNFTGSNINQSGYFPPDTQGAAGNASYVELVNGRYAVYSKSSGSLLQSSSLDSFWTSAFSGTNFSLTGAAFDPRVVYDASAGLFYASALDFGTTDANGNSQNNDILLAVSNSSDPTAGWKAVKYAASQGADNYFADFDTLGFNGDGVYVSVNDFPTTDPDAADPDSNLPPVSPDGISENNATSYGVSILTAPKSSLAAQTTNGLTLFYNQNPNNTGFVAHPVNDQDAVNGTPGTEYIFSDYNTPAAVNKISSIAGPATTPTLNIAGGFVTVTAYNGPPNAHQPGGPNTLDAGDSRFGSSVVEVNGELWAVQDVSVAGRAGLNWIRIDPATSTVIAEGTIADPAHDYYYGSIAVNGQGSVVIGYTRSGDTEYASSYASLGSYGATNVTFGSPLLLKAGVADYSILDDPNGGRNRWGDYSSTMVDPNNPLLFWTSQEWASGTNTWSTQITELAAAPEPTTIATIGIGGLGLFGCILRKRRARTATTDV